MLRLSLSRHSYYVLCTCIGIYVYYTHIYIHVYGYCMILIYYCFLLSMCLLPLFSVHSSQLRWWLLVACSRFFTDLLAMRKIHCSCWDFPGWLEANLHQPEPDFHANRARTVFPLFDFNLRSVLDQFTQARPNFRQTFNSYCILIQRPLGGCCWL